MFAICRCPCVFICVSVDGVKTEESKEEKKEESAEKKEEKVSVATFFLAKTANSKKMCSHDL